MKIIDGFKLRTISGEMVVCGEGVDQINFGALIVLNESASFLWQSVEGKEFDQARLAELLMSEYQIDEALAKSDAEAIARRWIEAKIVAE
ncbi:MAG: PqqD family protein [Rikenellaceae bacterium]